MKIKNLLCIFVLYWGFTNVGCEADSVQRDSYSEQLKIYATSEDSGVVLFDLHFEYSFNTDYNLNSTILHSSTFPLFFLQIAEKTEFDFFEFNFQQGRWNENIVQRYLKTGAQASLFKTTSFDFQIYDTGLTFIGIFN